MKSLCRVSIVAVCIAMLCSSCMAVSQGTEIVEFTGTVRYIDMEGGFYGIVADDGSRFDPENLPEQYARDGARVAVKASLNPRRMMSTHMWGARVRIISVDACGE